MRLFVTAALAALAALAAPAALAAAEIDVTETTRKAPLPTFDVGAIVGVTQVNTASFEDRLLADNPSLSTAGIVAGWQPGPWGARLSYVGADSTGASNGGDALYYKIKEDQWRAGASYRFNPLTPKGWLSRRFVLGVESGVLASHMHYELDDSIVSISDDSRSYGFYGALSVGLYAGPVYLMFSGDASRRNVRFSRFDYNASLATSSLMTGVSYAF